MPLRSAAAGKGVRILWRHIERHEWKHGGGTSPAAGGGGLGGIASMLGLDSTDPKQDE